MENNYVYSLDNEIYSEDDPHDVITEAAEDVCPLKVGSIVKVYRGKAITPKASDFLPDILYIMMECASDQCPDEVAWEWPNVTEGQKIELERAISNVVDGWAEKHNQKPSFFNVVNCEEVKFRVTGVSSELYDFTYEEVE